MQSQFGDKVNAYCLPEGAGRLSKLFLCFITQSWRDTAVQNAVLRHILYKLGANAVTKLKVTGGGVIKHSELNF